MSRHLELLRPVLLIMALGFATSACVSLQSVTSGQIGCSEDDIQIGDEKSGWGSRTWTAMCHGKTYFCSAHGGGQNATPQVSCKEQNGAADAPAAAAPAAAPAGGCQFDTQCKGDRVCKAGSCVEPPPK